MFAEATSKTSPGRTGEQRNNGRVPRLLQHPDPANRTNQDAASRVGFAVCRFELSLQPRQFGLRLVYCRVPRKPADQAHHCAGPQRQPVAERQPCANIAVGIQMAFGFKPATMPWKCSAILITVKAVPLMRTVVPTTRGSSANRVRQKSWLRIAAMGSPARHAILVNRKDATRSGCQAQ